MAGVELGAALRQIQRLFSAGSATGISDTQLLHQFAARRDEAAFAALLERHGPMVLAVCRGILRDPLDAEDAFQATFVVLARKASSAWAEGQLGGWLHKVAYRIAVRASTDARRRRAHEQRAAEVAAMEIRHAAQIDDSRQALHEELARLPAKLRLPLVLCYLEGLTHAQAAAALRCGEATVRRRLAGGRERLRQRLARRGCAPVALGLSAALATEANAAVPPLCAQATLRAVMRIAAGEAVATAAGAGVARLAQGGSTLLGNPWNTTAAALAVAAVACAGAGLAVLRGKSAAPAVARQSAPNLERPRAGQAAGAGAGAAAKPAEVAAASPHQSGSRKYTINGVVHGPDGKPLPAATVYWVAYPRFERKRMAMPKGYKEKPEELRRTLTHGITDAEGRFELSAEFDAEGFPARTVIVKAPGLGLSGRVFLSEAVKESAGPDGKLSFRLPPAATIEGRLLTPAGAPAEGVKVLLEDFRDSDNELEGNWVVGARVDQDEQWVPEYWPPSWTTDKDGRFRIEGIVPEKTFARLHFRHPDFANDDLFVSTGLPVSDWLRAFNVKPVAAKFTHTLEPARRVTGVVTDKETGKPLPGVLIEMVPMRLQNRYGGNVRVAARTDESGHYRAAGASGDFYWVAAYADPASGYLPYVKRDNKWPPGASALEIDIALPRGQVLRGQVVEAGTGRRVAEASVVYQPAPANPHNRNDYSFDSPVLTDKSGSFALTVLPGAGLLAVEAPTPDFIRVPLTGPSSERSSIARPHGFARLNIPVGKDAESHPVHINLRKGVRLEARLVGPDGAPLESVMGWCAEVLASQLENWVSPQIYNDGRFRLEGADPERAYRAFFLQPKRRLGAVAELKYDAKGPLEVRLQPTATAKGVVVDTKGRPVKATQILPYMALTADDRELKEDDFVGNAHAVVYLMFTMEPLLPTYPAEFHYDKLIPGVRFYVATGAGYYPLPVLKPGEVRDLGKIVAQPRGSQ